MTRRSIILLSVLVLFAVASEPLIAQSTTGRLRGTVTDSDGGVIPGVTVTISSEVLMGGTRTAVTGDTGAFRFTGLAPGAYNVIAELDGFKPETLEGIKVGLGGTANANFVLYPAEFVEAVTVTSEAPLVDLTTSSVGTSFTAEFIKDLPTTRNFYDMITVAAGVALGTEDSSRVNAFGSNVQSNAWYTDGIEVTGPETGTSWISINPDMIEEIQVLGIGAPAEYGNMLGAALNVVTKSGSNQLKGGVNAYWFDDSLVDSDINYSESEFPEYHQEEFWDVSATLGGPIMKDRLWFIAAYEYWRDGHTFPGTDPAQTSVWFQDRYDFKLSARINDRNLLDLKGGYNEWGFPAVPSPFWEASAQAGEVGDDSVWGLSWQSIFSDRTYLEVRYAGWKSNDDNLSKTGSTEAAFIDYTPIGGGPPTYAGGYWWPWTYDTSTNQISATVSYFADDFLKGDHDFKFGVQANEGDAITRISPSATGSYYYHYLYEYDYYGSIYEYDYFVRVDGLPYYYGNEQKAWGVFVDDSWTVTDRLTLNLGLRYDNHKGIIPSFNRLDASGRPTGETVPGVDPVFTWSKISPRIGFAYNLGADRRTVVRGSFGIYYDGNVGGNWNSPPPLPPTLTANASLSGPNGPFDIFWWDFDAGANNVDPDLQPPQTYQYALGFERELGNKYSIGVLGVYKDTSNQIGWQFLDDGVYETFQFTDPFNGREYTLRDYSVFPTTRKGNGPGDTAAGPLPDYWGKYWGVVLEFNRRFTDWWGMQASYTYSDSTGLNPRALSQWQNNPLYGSKEGSHPNQWFNVDGAVQTGDRPHMFRVQANFELPWNMHANTNINLQSGRPYFRQLRAPYATSASRQDYFVAEEFRHPFQSLIDFGIGKRFNIPGDGELKVDLQFFNLFNNDATDWFETVVLAPGDEFIPTWWVKPRRLMLRLGVEY
jgi:outer membrane receptor protein involved in Fe transport